MSVFLHFATLGISLLASAQTEEMDVLWGVSPDPFPFQSPLKEMQVRTEISYMLFIRS